MPKYINADELIKFCTSKLVETKDDVIIQAHNNAFRCMREHINSLPAADVVEVVRCKDCISKNKAKVNNKGFLICPDSEMEICDDDYCSYGERRESDADIH